MGTDLSQCALCFTEPVVGYCVNCGYSRLCQTCFNNHPKVKIFKNHTINTLPQIGKCTHTDDLETKVPGQPERRIVHVDVHKQKCERHTEEKQSFYCEKHDICICSHCLFSDHKACFDSVVDLTSVTHDADNFNRCVSTLQELEKETVQIVSDIEDNIKLNDELRASCEKDINTFYEELVDKLVVLKKEAMTEVSNIHHGNTEGLNNALLSCKENQGEIQQQNEDVEQLMQISPDQNVYVSLKRMERKVIEFKGNNQQCKQNTDVTKLNFIRNVELEKILQEEASSLVKSMKLYDDGAYQNDHLSATDENQYQLKPALEEGTRTKQSLTGMLPGSIVAPKPTPSLQLKPGSATLSYGRRVSDSQDKANGAQSPISSEQNIFKGFTSTLKSAQSQRKEHTVVTATMSTIPKFFTGFTLTPNTSRPADVKAITTCRHPVQTPDKSFTFGPYVDFKLVNQLTNREGLKTRVEEEDNLFCEPAILYRSNSGQWIETGIGEMMILRHKVTNNVRIRMMREHNQRLCANHTITLAMKLSPMPTSNRSWVWNAMDYSESTAKADTFAVTFRTQDIADKFKAAFVKSQTEIGSQAYAKTDIPLNAKQHLLPPTIPSKSATITTNLEYKISTPVIVSSTPSSVVITTQSSESKRTLIPGAVGVLASTNEKTSTLAGHGQQMSVSASEATAKKFAIGFKTPDIADKFKVAFEKYQTEMGSQPAGAKADTAFKASQAADVKTEGVKEAAKGDLASLFKKSEGTWTCDGCYINNAADILKCPCCHSLKPGVKAEDVKVTSNLPSFASCASGAFIFNTSATGQTGKGDFSSVFKQTEGSWTCDGCYVNNAADVLKCPCCATMKPGVKVEDVKVTSSLTSLGPSDSDGFAFNTSATGRTGKVDLASVFKKTEGSWTCDGCYVSNAADVLKCRCCGALKPGVKAEDVKVTSCSTTLLYQNIPHSDEEVIITSVENATEEEIEKAKALLLPDNFYMYTRRKDCHGCHGCTDDLSMRQPVTDSQANPKTKATKEDEDGSIRDGDVYNDVEPETESEMKDVGEEDEADEHKEENENVALDENSDEEVIITSVENATEEEIEKAKALLLPDNFYMYTRRKDCRGCRGCTDGLSMRQPVTDSQANANTKATKEDEDGSYRDGDDHNVVEDGTEHEMKVEDEEDEAGEHKEENEKVALDGNSDFNQPFHLQDAGKKLCDPIPGGGRVESGDDDDDYYDDDDDDDDNDHVDDDGVGADEASHEHSPQFGTFVDLAEGLDVKTGEEDEAVVYSQRSKLFRFDKDANQLKEKGMGEMIILKHKDTGKYRLLMRRELVHKLACNHHLTADLVFSVMKTSETSWCWTAQDYSESEPMMEQFALKFKNVDTANAFKAKIDEIQTELRGQNS